MREYLGVVVVVVVVVGFKEIKLKLT